MPFQVRPALPTDIAANDKISVAAFGNGLSRYIYPNGRTEADRAHNLRHIKKYFLNQGPNEDGISEHGIVVYDTDALAPSSHFELPDGFNDADCVVPEEQRKQHPRVAGLAFWVVQPHAIDPEKPEKKEDDTPPPTANKELLKQFRAALTDGRKKHLAGRPHVLLHVLAVDPEYQRKGIGSLLLQWGFEKADELGVPVYLEATDAGRPLYWKAGFKDLEPLQGFDTRDFGADEQTKFWLMIKDAKEKGSEVDGKVDGEVSTKP